MNILRQLILLVVSGYRLTITQIGILIVYIAVLDEEIRYIKLNRIKLKITIQRL